MTKSEITCLFDLLSIQGVIFAVLITTNYMKMIASKNFVFHSLIFSDMQNIGNTDRHDKKTNQGCKITSLSKKKMTQKYFSFLLSLK